jgi:hypothetical protein
MDLEKIFSGPCSALPTLKMRFNITNNPHGALFHSQKISSVGCHVGETYQPLLFPFENSVPHAITQRGAPPKFSIAPKTITGRTQMYRQ